MRIRLLAAALTGAAALTASPATAAPVCHEVDTKLAGARVCLTLPDGGTVACVSASVDPSRSTVDDVIAGYVCLDDQGSGTQVFHCLVWGRTVITCSR